MTPLVSIVMPAYNSSSFISPSIQSVISQTFDNWELLIVDDASTDNTCEIVKNFQKIDQRIRLIHLEQNQGAAVARNTAIKEALGRYIAFLDCDDLWLSEKLSIQLNHMAETDCALCYGAYYVIDEQDHQKAQFTPPETLNYRDLLKTCSIGCLTAIYDRDKVGTVYMPLLRKRQDYGLWLKILKTGATASGVLTPLAKYRQRENSISSNKLKAAIYQWKIYRDVERLSLSASFFYFLNYAIAGILKYR